MSEPIYLGVYFKREIGKYSIKGIELFHPIVINEKDELVAGLRGLEAYKELGWEEIPITKINIQDLMKEEYIEG